MLPIISNLLYIQDAVVQSWIFFLRTLTDLLLMEHIYLNLTRRLVTGTDAIN